MAQDQYPQRFMVYKPTVSDITTTGNDYVPVPFHKPNSTEEQNFWECPHIAGVKLFQFWATIKDLKVQIMGSIDGTNFTDAVVAEFVVTQGAATPTTKRVPDYWPFRQVQVKPSAAGQNGTLTTLAAGTTAGGPALANGAATESTLSGINGKLPASLGKKAATASLSVVQADPTRTPVAHAKDMTGAAVALSAVSVICQGLWLLAVGATGTTHWGDSSVAAGHGMPLSTTVLQHIQGPIDLATVYCNGNAADSVAYNYTYEA